MLPTCMPTNPAVGIEYIGGGQSFEYTQSQLLGNAAVAEQQWKIDQVFIGKLDDLVFVGIAIAWKIHRNANDHGFVRGAFVVETHKVRHFIAAGWAAWPPIQYHPFAFADILVETLQLARGVAQFDIAYGGRRCSAAKQKEPAGRTFGTGLRLDSSVSKHG